MSTTLPSLDAIQARADAVLLCDRPDCDLRKCQDQRVNAAMLAALRAVLDLHTEREHRPLDGIYLGGTVCNHCRHPWPCATIRAVTAHIDTTPKEKP